MKTRAKHLTNRWSQPLAVAMRTLNFKSSLSSPRSTAVSGGSSLSLRVEETSGTRQRVIDKTASLLQLLTILRVAQLHQALPALHFKQIT